ncbi:MAG TPA: metal-dependent hydrolase [Gammaproteobacteria bacterium]
MDPIAHTFTGAALAAAGLRRTTPLASAALVIGANAPDIDVVTMFAGDYASLAFRRGWTHGLLAVAVLPLVVTGLLLLWERIVRRRRPEAAPARAGPLLGLAALAVLTHPTLDWLNNYGLRWLMPFDGRWFYGDALFIIDPWVWLALGGVLFLAHSRRPAALGAWAVLWALASVLVFTAEIPLASPIVWTAGLTAFVAARAAGIAGDTHPRRIERGARAALALVAAYMAVQVAANVPARAEVRAALAARGIDAVESVMIGPNPADPFAGSVVAETPDAYYTGRWHWLESPRFRPDAQPIPKNRRGPVAEAAAAALPARRYLTWSRFPFFEIEADDSGYTVTISDARYRGIARLGGVVVRLDRDLRPVEEHR